MSDEQMSEFPALCGAQAEYFEQKSRGRQSRDTFPLSL